MIAGIARMKSQIAFAGLALTLLVSAGTPMLGGEDALAKGGKHCVGELDAASGEIGREASYRTFAQAQAAGGEGRGGQNRNYQHSIIGILYDNTNYDTSAGTYTRSTTQPNERNLNGMITFNTLGSFDNRTSSAKIFSGCKATFFADSFLSGTAKTGSVVNGYDIPNMESMTNRASSVKFAKG